MAHKTYYFRSPNRSTFLSDLKSEMQDAGIDPYAEKAVVETQDGDQLGQGIDLIPAGQWYETAPTYADDGKLTTEGTTGDYALINVRTAEEDIQGFCESFDAQDPALSPSEVPDTEKVGGGSHRVEAPQTPVRRFATK